MNSFRHLHTALLLIAMTFLPVTGCARNYAGPPPPPPSYRGVPALIQSAEHQGFRAGSEDGTRDAYNRRGYHPKRDRKFRDTPGYNPSLGPFGAYRNQFRNAYLRGYDSGFYRR